MLMASLPKNKSIFMKRTPAIIVILFVGVFLSRAQEISYGTGTWDPEGLGNHRTVIYVERPSDAVQVSVPWRRLDNVDNKDIILMDALTDRPVKNKYCVQKNRESGEIIFEPVSGQGYYYLYYMPCRNGGSSWFPDVIYQKPAETFDPDWKNRTASSINKQVARTVAFESQSEYHSFYPMEVPVNQDELAELLKTQLEKDFLLFPEDRNFPVRMTETIPLRWYSRGANTLFEGSALKDESYAWQVGIFAPFKHLQNVKLTFSDLTSDTGRSIAADANKCINMGGIDHLGREFRRIVNIPKGEVRSMWVITDIPGNQSPGVYKGKVEVSAEGMATSTVDVSIRVREETVVNRGYDTPKNMSRLNWLDSDTGLDDEVVAPYTPVVLRGNTVAVLGRKLDFNQYGFPASITSSFTHSNHSTQGPEKQILSEAIRLDIQIGGDTVHFKAKKPVITLQTGGAVAWQTKLRSANFDLEVQAKMECDGYVNYETIIKAKNEVTIDDIQLVLPYEKSTAKYLMGMGRQGGYMPDSLTWKWEQEYANNMLWIGDVNAGLQLKLKHVVPDWKLFTFGKTGTYRDWSNDGKGGCKVEHTGKAVLVTAYTGMKSLKANDEVILNFGLLITPFHPLDDKHWNERYYHRPDNNPEQAAKLGATVMNVHHANQYNPYINYPFLSEDQLIPLVEKANKHHIRTKLYYTVRELSTLLPELWALRHLDDEIYTRNQVVRLADEREVSESKVMFGMTGHSWLWEHLRTHYDPAWHCPPDPAMGLDWDMSIRTQGLSRWHNYYIEGLNYLVKKTGMRGLYLDGVGYDREIMKRVRKTLDRAADSCLIDFHSGNAFHAEYGMNSPANNYMELFPYVNSLWLGEGYDYDSEPDYWLVEIAGIPFGLYGEMLHGCGNAYRGMVYGMSTRFYGGCSASNIWKLWDQFGISGSEFIGYWDEANPVHTGNKHVLASVYAKEDKVMIAMGNWTKTKQNIRLKMDWAKLGMDPDQVSIEIPEIEGLQQSSWNVNVNNLNVPASAGLILIVRR
jgi:hypothetical protein